VKCPKEKFKKIKGARNRRIFHSTDSSGSDSSGEGEMIAHLKETFHITGKKREMSKFSCFFQRASQLGKSNKMPKPCITWFRMSN
jgi:hypothetical protein